MKNRFLYILLITLMGLWSCTSDDNSGPKGEYAKGIFVVNEGNFGLGNGSVSHFNTDTKEVEQDIFKSVNEIPLGDVVQSMHVDGKQAYIVVNNSKKVEVVDLGTFKSTATISAGLANPRYMATKGTKGYISNWGNFDASFNLDQSFIAVVDLTNQALLKKINTQNGTENVLIVGDRLFVSNNFTSTVEIINLATEAVEKSLTVGNSPGALAVDNAGTVWVVCGGSWGGNDGKLVSINASNGSIQKTIDLGFNVAAKMAINKPKNQHYIYSGKKVYRHQNNTVTPFLDITEFTSIYGIGFDEKNGHLYVSDDAGFAGNGTVRRYSEDGSLIDSFISGIGPNGFVFIVE